MRQALIKCPHCGKMITVREKAKSRTDEELNRIIATVERIKKVLRSFSEKMEKR